jgi:cytidyltransferase-like protein
MRKKFLGIDELTSFRNDLSKENKKIGLCHGVYDLLHLGHIRHFNEARSKVDVLVVSVTANAWVNKGKGRPVFSDVYRAEVIANLEIVDHVVINDSDTSVPIINKLKPHLYFKGLEYQDFSKDESGNIYKENEALLEIGGKIHFTSDIVFSSSNLLNNYFSRYDPVTKAKIDEIRKKYSIQDIKNWFEKMKDVKLTVVGETIIDSYIDVLALGKSSKDSILCFNEISKNSYYGGALAVARHMNGLDLKPNLITGLNSRDENSNNIKQLCLNENINLICKDILPRPNIEKTRYLELNSGQKVFELYKMDDQYFDSFEQTNLDEMIKETLSKSDLVIVMDYGHGFINEASAKILTEHSNHLVVNCQSNGGNQGLNSFEKYEKGHLLSLNYQEMIRESKFKHSKINDYFNEKILKNKFGSVLLTKGADGLELWENGALKSTFPALGLTSVDKVGAGDAVLSVVATLNYLEAPSDLITFVGNVVGAFAITYRGNSEIISKSKLLKEMEIMLK